MLTKNKNKEKPKTESELNDWKPEHPKSYVVVRDDLRVSDKEYEDKSDQEIIKEKTHWENITKKWPDGSKVEIVEFDKKKHKIW